MHPDSQMPDPTIAPEEYGRLYDPIVASVVDQFWERSSKGVAKYGSTLADSRLPLKAFLRHAQEEAMDFALYLETLSQKQASIEKAITELIIFWSLNEDSPDDAELLFRAALTELINLTEYVPNRAEHQAIVDYFSH